MSLSLINPTQEFLVVKHSYLNGNDLNLEGAVDDSLGLGEYTAGRVVVPCFEGDLSQVKGTGEIILTHQSFSSPTPESYRRLREQRIAASLDETLEKVAHFRQSCPEQRVVLCLELKPVTSEQTVRTALTKLREYEIPPADVYFDSFYGGKLDLIGKLNQEGGTNYVRSLHLVGNLGAVPMAVTNPRQGYDIITIPRPLSFGHPYQSVIYGAVGDTETLARIAEDPQVVGAYVRFKEGGGGLKGALFKLFNSVTNTAKLRRLPLLLLANAV